MKSERGFTLVEMLVVLLIISILILVTIPNVTKYSEMIDDKGCEAYLKMVQGQAETYKIEHNTYPTIEQLKTENYLGTGEVACPNGSRLSIDKGQVTVNKNESAND